MNKYIDINKDGFSIRCKVYFSKDIRDIKNIVVATYGFGGSKDNKAVEKFADKIVNKYKGFGVLCFDWPAHGNDGRNKLLVSECIDYLDMVKDYCLEEMHAENVFNYSSSFGAYITLRYIHEKGSNPFTKIAFRCPAIKMYDAISGGVEEDEWAKMKKGKEIIRGYDRKIKLDLAFFEDLRDHDVSSYEYIDYADDILLVHGTKDQAVPIEVTEEFSENNVIELLTVENADHPFSNPKYMDFAIQSIIRFFEL